MTSTDDDDDDDGTSDSTEDTHVPSTTAVYVNWLECIAKVTQLTTMIVN